VHTLNEGTKEYIDAGMETLIKDLDILSLVEKFGNRETRDKNRGNSQKNFGVSCGQNVGAPATEEDTLKFFGCSLPRLADSSNDPCVVKAFDVGWQVGRKIGIDYCQDKFIDENPWSQ
jgi:hypothetical protein